MDLSRTRLLRQNGGCETQASGLCRSEDQALVVSDTPKQNTFVKRAELAIRKQSYITAAHRSPSREAALPIGNVLHLWDVAHVS